MSEATAAAAAAAATATTTTTTTCIGCTMDDELDEQYNCAAMTMILNMDEMMNDNTIS